MGTTGDESDYAGTTLTSRTAVIPRAVQAILDGAETARISSGPGSSWECRVSFLELYNEEIIDLLAVHASTQIVIREEKDGRIVWQGVREVAISTLEEAMQLLQAGSERRKTGATGMNASSSRSHAIFSLTLVQKKREVAATEPNASASTPPRDTVETPTRLRRPASGIGMSSRTATPTNSRMPPPSRFASAKAALPRTPSKTSLRQRGDPGSDDPEGFVVITSKYNMVDLAGSERLKRTAAEGERMKEGIAINSGLSALGNVISTCERWLESWHDCRS